MFEIKKKSLKKGFCVLARFSIQRESISYLCLVASYFTKLTTQREFNLFQNENTKYNNSGAFNAVSGNNTAVHRVIEEVTGEETRWIYIDTGEYFIQWWVLYSQWVTDRWLILTSSGRGWMPGRHYPYQLQTRMICWYLLPLNFVYFEDLLQNWVIKCVYFVFFSLDITQA